MRILLVGGGLQGLCCGAAFHNKGYTVDVVSNDLQIVNSKFFDTIYNHACSYNEDIYDILSKNQYDILIPMGDVNVSFLSKNKPYIEDTYSCKCACSDYDILSIVEDKHRFMSFCETHDVPHPKTLPLIPKNIKEYAQTIGYPLLIKPDFSVGARGITKVSNYRELCEKYPLIVEQFGACTLQEYIDNKEYYYNVMLYRNHKGEFLAHTIIKIVRMYPISAGSSTCCISVEDDKLLQICKECLDKLNWVGMADFDVLQRLDNNEYKIIEINARVPASLKGSLISGVNFPEVILKDLMCEEIPRYNYQSGKVMRYLGTDFLWFLKSENRFKSYPSWFNFFGKNVYYQDIYKEDPSSWWSWLAEGFKKLSKRNKRLR